MRLFLSLLFCSITMAAQANWCGYQVEPDKDPNTALKQSWVACGSPSLPGPYGTPATREAYAQEKGADYMSLAEFFNNAFKTCFYAAHYGATSDQIDTCQTSYRLLGDEQGPGPLAPSGYDPFLMNR